ncbi:glycerate kinase family protein [Leifsonia psychrotolerans]
MTRRRILIAPDSFKGTATAIEVARALAAGWASVHPLDDLVLLPMADGGEGTLDAFEVAFPGARRMPLTVQGPDNRPADAHWLLLPDGTGIVELANTSGITLLEALLPLDAHTLGFGQAIAAALDHGVDRLLLALGGSSSSDGGAGALTALGALFLDAMNRPVRLGNRGLGALATTTFSSLRSLPPHGAQILSDVTNPLLGEQGAAVVYGPQKGANPAQVAGLESNLRRLARLIPVDPTLPGTGAAGGTAFGMLAWGARLTSGARAVADVLGVPAALAGASVLITGEGRFDAQSAAGKVAAVLAALSTDAGVPALLVAGKIEAEPTGFVAAQSLTKVAGSSAAAMADPLRHLHTAGAALARAQLPQHSR